MHLYPQFCRSAPQRPVLLAQEAGIAGDRPLQMAALRCFVKAGSLAQVSPVSAHLLCRHILLPQLQLSICQSGSTSGRLWELPGIFLDSLPAPICASAQPQQVLRLTCSIYINYALLAGRQLI